MKATSLLVVVVLAGCQREAPPPEAKETKPEPATAAAPARAEIHEDVFDVALRPVGSYTAGASGSAEIELLPKSGFHCNDQYPYKFKTGDASSVKFGAPVFDKTAVHLEEKRATLKVDFTPESKGEQTVAGVFSFSVCSAEKCLVEKRELALKIAVN